MTLRLFRVIAIFLLITNALNDSIGQITDKKFENLLKKSSKLAPILDKRDEYEIQLIYTKINRDEQNHPSFETQYFNHDPKRYFYPASTVKLPAVLLSLEKLNNLNIKGLDKDTPMNIEKAFERHEAVYSDSTSENGKASVGHYSKKILLVSDNDAFNRLYEFMGQEAFNEKLKEKGYKNLRILHRLSIPFSSEENRITPELWFGEQTKLPVVPLYAEVDRMGVVEVSRLYKQEAQKNTSRIYTPNIPIRKGKGYMKGNEVINEPFDFTNKNFFALSEQHEMLKAIMFPNAVTPSLKFNLTEKDYQFLYKYMGMLPKETTYPNYNTPEYWDSYVKFLMFGDNKNPMPDHIRIFNKVGDAYGYLIDNAYIVDFKNNIEFMLSAVIHVNKNHIYNDGVYEYDEIGLPFMAELGKVVYNNELTRKRKHQPNLEKFKIKQ